jgi:hypothetical protein
LWGFQPRQPAPPPPPHTHTALVHLVGGWDHASGQVHVDIRDGLGASECIMECCGAEESRALRPALCVRLGRTSHMFEPAWQLCVHSRCLLALLCRRVAASRPRPPCAALL